MAECVRMKLIIDNYGKKEKSVHFWQDFREASCRVSCRVSRRRGAVAGDGLSGVEPDSDAGVPVAVAVQVVGLQSDTSVRFVVVDALRLDL